MTRFFEQPLLLCETCLVEEQVGNIIAIAHLFNERYGLFHIFLRASRVTQGEMVHTGSEVLVCSLFIALKPRIKSAFIERDSNATRVACLLHVLQVGFSEAPRDIIFAANMGYMR